MNFVALCRNSGAIYSSVVRRCLAVSAQRFGDPQIIDPPDTLELAYLNYEKRKDDPIDIKKARLLYQSRKRGMLENGILLSSFASKYLSTLTESQIDEYDKIINLPSNDWDIFYWAMGMRPTPEMFDNSVMQLLKDHIKTAARDNKGHQPNLGPDNIYRT